MHQQIIPPTDALHSLLSNLPSKSDAKYQAHFEQIKQAITDGANVNEWRPDGTPLQKIISKPKVNVEVLSLLLEKGAKSYIPDAKYQLPVQVVGASPLKKKSVIELFKWRSVLGQDYLDQVIEFCLEFYIGEKNSSHEDNRLLDFATSLLTGTGINPLLAKKETWMKYIAHLREIKQASLGEEIKFKLEGWQQTIFLATRIRALLEMIIELKFSEVSPSQIPLLEAIKLLKKEILLEIESLNISQAVSIIKTFPKKDDQKELAGSLACSISTAMSNFLKEPGDEYYIPSGWVGHSLYISFVRLDNADVMVRSDNLGSRPPQCHWKENKKFYPALLGTTKIDVLQQGKQRQYIENLIMAKIAPYPPKTDQKERAAARQQFFQTIYSDAIQELKLTAVPQATLHLTLQQRGYTASFSQKAGTCVVTNHNVGLRLRLKTEIFYQWVLEQEMARLGKIAYDSPTDISDWWPKFRQPRQLSQRIVHDCKQHCQRQSAITFLFAEPNLPSQGHIEFVIPDVLEKEFKHNEWHTHSTSATTLYEKYLERNLSLFVQGRAGMGKSTVCRYIASRWSVDRLWRNKFTLVLYIPLRNLNPNRYPPQQAYQLIDVVKKECFSLKSIPSFEEGRLEEILASKQVLWLLDGYDELPALSDSLTAVIAEISKKPRLIITSRYPLPSHLMPKIYLETAGFNNDGIDQYIENFYHFYNALSDESQQLKQFLHSHKIIEKSATIPINLEIICSIWQANRRELQEAKILTTTHLYHNITLWLLRRFLLRDNEFLTQPAHLVESSKLRNEHRVLRRLAPEMQTLETIAFYMMQGLLYQLPSKELVALIPPAMPDLEAFKADVIDIGILVPSGDIKQEVTELKDSKGEPEEKIEVTEYKEPGNYEFIHASFQEFFTARYVVGGLYQEGTERHRDAIAFITARKYNRLAIMVFIAGLLSGSTAEDKKARQHFWRALQQPPYDVTQLNQVNLLISCLQQTLASNPSHTVDGSIITYLNQTLLSVFQHRDDKAEVAIENFNFERLLQTLRTAHQVIAHPDLCRTYIIALAYVDEYKNIATGLIGEVNANSRRLIIETAQQLLFLYSNTVDIYIIMTVKNDPEIAKQFCDILLKEAHDPFSPHQINAIWLLGHLNIKDPKVTETLKNGLSAENPKVRFQSIQALGQLLIYDEDIFQQLGKIAKHDGEENIRKAADEVMGQLRGYQAHCEEYDYDSPEEDNDYADYLYEQKVEEAKADDEKAPSYRTIRYLFDDFRQTPLDRWVTEGYYTQKYKLRGQEKKWGDDELQTRKTEKKHYSLFVKKSKDKRITIKVSERVNKEYQWLQQGESNLTLDHILALDNSALQFLIEKKLYLPNTEFKAILTAYVKSSNDLLADLVIKHALEKDITLVVIGEGFLIYKQQNEKEIQVGAESPVIITHFIKKFNTLTKPWGLRPLPALFDSPYSLEVQTLFAEYERLKEVKYTDPKEDEPLKKICDSIHQALIKIYPSDDPATRNRLEKRLIELTTIPVPTEAQKLEKRILGEIKPKMKAEAEEKQGLPPLPPADEHSVPVFQNKAMESVEFTLSKRMDALRERLSILTAQKEDILSKMTQNKLDNRLEHALEQILKEIREVENEFETIKNKQFNSKEQKESGKSSVLMESSLSDSFDTVHESSKIRKIEISQSGYSFLITAKTSSASKVSSEIHDDSSISSAPSLRVQWKN